MEFKQIKEENVKQEFKKEKIKKEKIEIRTLQIVDDFNESDEESVQPMEQDEEEDENEDHESDKETDVSAEPDFSDFDGEFEEYDMDYFHKNFTQIDFDYVRLHSVEVGVPKIREEMETFVSEARDMLEQSKNKFVHYGLLTMLIEISNDTDSYQTLYSSRHAHFDIDKNCFTRGRALDITKLGTEKSVRFIFELLKYLMRQCMQSHYVPIRKVVYFMELFTKDGNKQPTVKQFNSTQKKVMQWLDKIMVHCKVTVNEFMIAPIFNLSIYGQITIYSGHSETPYIDQSDFGPFRFTFGKPSYENLRFEVPDTVKRILILDSISAIDIAYEAVTQCNAIVIIMPVSALADRILLKSIVEQLNLPVYIITDCDVGGFKLFFKLKFGAPLDFQLNLDIAIPQLIRIGVDAGDIKWFIEKLPKLIEKADDPIRKSHLQTIQENCWYNALPRTIQMFGNWLDKPHLIINPDIIKEIESFLIVKRTMSCTTIPTEYDNTLIAQGFNLSN